MLTIGNHSMARLVAYLRQYPRFMDRLMRLYNDFDLSALKEFSATLDLDAPPGEGPLTHRRYMENKQTIDALIQDPQSYPDRTENKDYLTDSHIRRTYGRGADTYDALWAGSWPYELRQSVVKWLELFPGCRLLEVGVGTGTNLEALPDHVRITGIDLCPQMLAVARKKVVARKHEAVDLQVMDAARMEFADNSFDRVLAFYTLCATRDPLAVLREISRVCKPGGAIVIFDVIRSPIDEVAVLQYLFRPVARELGAIYLEFSPPYAITYDAYLDLYPLLEIAGITVRRARASDPYATVNLLQCANKA